MVIQFSLLLYVWQESTRTVTESATHVMKRVSSAQGRKVTIASAVFLHGELVLTL